MPYLIQFLLKFSLSLGLMFLFYQFVLRPLTFYQWNRFYLIGYSLLAFIIPVININSWLEKSQADDSALMQAIPAIGSMALPARFLAADEQEGVFTKWTCLYVVLAAGAVAMMIRLFLQYRSLQAIKRNAVKRSSGAVQLYDVGTDISPFSFANAIFLNTSAHSEEEVEKIIQHEFVHVKQKHTVDILIGELLCIFNWFNPFAWLIRKAIRQNLEFIADDHVLQSGLDARQYQYLLLKVIGIPQYNITTHFNLSSLKKRIVMMNKIKSARLHLVKFLFALPMLALLLLAFRKEQVNELKVMFLKPGNAQTNDTVPPPPPPPPPPPSAKKGKVVGAPSPAAPLVPPVSGKSPDAEAIPAPTAPAPPPAPVVRPLPDNVTSLVIDTRATIVYKDGTKETFDLNKAKDKAAYERKFGQLPQAPIAPLQPVKTNVSVKPEVAADVKAQPLTADSKPSPGMDVKVVDPAAIASVDVVKGNAVDVYKNESTHEVDIVTTNTNTDNRDKVNTRVEKRTTESDVMISGPKVTLNDLQNFKGLIIVNGKEVKKEEVKKIDPNTIKVVNILKGENAVRQYKDKGKDGVIIVTTKDSNQ